MNRTRPLTRVVYVVSLFPCVSETFIVREIGALIARGVDVRIISLKKPSKDLVQTDSAALLDRVRHPLPWPAAVAGVARECVRAPATVLRAAGLVVIDGWRRPMVALKSLAALFRALQHARWLRDFDPQVIHAHWATYPSTAAWALARLTDRPFSFTSHAHDIYVENQLLAHKITDAALAVTISRFNVDWLSARATPAARDKLRIVHCGVDMENSPWQAGARDARSILAVGRLDPVKGFETLVDAIALLAQQGIDVDCRLVGTGPLEQVLRRRAGERGVADRIEFTGAQPQERIRDWMRSATMFALPSQVAADGNRDGIPVALMEAMASGCPVISTRVSGIPELIEHDRNGLLVEPRDPAALADAIRSLMADPALRSRLALQARRHIEAQFDARKEAGRLHALMQEAADAA
ncbi:glycosyltransferase [Marilutibacter maris]|uniref:Glycosyltransferase, group 1 family protein n=1 Tax=Marilutibacter maris TaxID=1605891 RepID=A0A2U9T8M0_9GAMM|nr:glycosyltransferase [Lysobacter maris]AWV07715.1 glycosyltransferase, group 1 family protein [Lysobacter maris]